MQNQHIIIHESDRMQASVRPQASVRGGRASACHCHRCAITVLLGNQYLVALEREGSECGEWPNSGGSSTGGKLNGGGTTERAGKYNRWE